MNDNPLLDFLYAFARQSGLNVTQIQDELKGSSELAKLLRVMLDAQNLARVRGRPRKKDEEFFWITYLIQRRRTEKGETTEKAMLAVAKELSLTEANVGKIHQRGLRNWPELKDRLYTQRLYELTDLAALFVNPGLTRTP